MTRTTAREIAMHLIYEMEYHDELPEELETEPVQLAGAVPILISRSRIAPLLGLIS